MSSDSEICESIDSVESIDESQDSEEDWGVVETEIIPYQDEPLADTVGEETMAVDGESDEEKDVDGQSLQPFWVSDMKELLPLTLG